MSDEKNLPPSYDEVVNVDEKKYYEDLIALQKENELLKQQLEYYKQLSKNLIQINNN
jgi:hypothetical protein